MPDCYEGYTAGALSNLVTSNVSTAPHATFGQYRRLTVTGTIESDALAEGVDADSVGGFYYQYQPSWLWYGFDYPTAGPRQPAGVGMENYPGRLPYTFYHHVTLEIRETSDPASELLFRHTVVIEFTITASHWVPSGSGYNEIVDSYTYTTVPSTTVIDGETIDPSEIVSHLDNDCPAEVDETAPAPAFSFAFSDRTGFSSLFRTGPYLSGLPFGAGVTFISDNINSYSIQPPDFFFRGAASDDEIMGSVADAAGHTLVAKNSGDNVILEVFPATAAASRELRYTLTGAKNPSIWRDKSNNLYLLTTNRSDGQAIKRKSRDSGRSFT